MALIDAPWHVLQPLLRNRRKRPLVRVMHLGFDQPFVDSLQPMLSAIGTELGVELSLVQADGELALVNAEFANSTSPQILNAFVEDRPMISMSKANFEGDSLLATLEQFEAHQRELLEQLQSLLPGVVRFRSQDAAMQTIDAAKPGSSGSPDSGFNSQFEIDDLLCDMELQSMVHQLLDGAVNPDAAPIHVSYGPGATLSFDFSTGVVRGDSLAWQHLRARRELPRLTAEFRPDDDAELREMDLVLWDIGLAASKLPLQQAAANWWEQPLTLLASTNIDRYTRVPHYLDLARLLAGGEAITPAELRRMTRVGQSELRRFLQACLVLGLASWALKPGPAAAPDHSSPGAASPQSTALNSRSA